MSLLDAVSTCWPPGVDDCVLWWDAWTFVVAALALQVAWLGLGVTCASALAVWRLGSEANRVAKSTQVLAETAQELDRNARRREARLIKSYLRGEIELAAAHAKTLVEMFPAIGEAELIHSRKRRDELRQQFLKIDLTLSHASVDRLHRLDGDEAGSIAGAIGMHGRIRAFAIVSWELELDERDARGVVLTLEKDAAALANHLRLFAEACKAQGH